MTDADLKLLTPYEGPRLRTPHRVAMAAMTRNRAGDARVPNELMATYYAQRATAGLMVTESVDVSPRAIGYPGTPGIYRPDQVDGWKQVVTAVRDAQPAPAPFFLQLFHTGRVSHVSLRPDSSPPLAPSAVRCKVELFTPQGMQPASEPHPLSTAEIATVVDEYVAAAQRAVEAGFDGVEVNAGNGYLIDQFLRDGTNRRTDGYGGSPKHRARLLVEIVDALGSAVGRERVAVRVSPVNETNDVTESDPKGLFTVVVDALARRDPAYLHVIEAADKRTITPTLRERFPGTLVVNDGYDRDKAEEAVGSGLADLVSFARLFLANPDLPARFAAGATLNEPDPSTFYGGGAEGYTSYPPLPATA